MSDAELEALYRARADSALARFSLADAEFMTRMIGHHAQALVMAELVPARTESPQLHTLGARITNAQQDEIETMRRWLEARGLDAPVAPATGVGAAQVGHDAAHATAGPGMLSAAELDRLGAASGVGFERLFLAFMIRHHEGAVAMVEELFATDGAARDPSVFKIASDIQVDQRTEIARMQRMLAALGGEPTR